MLWTRITVNLPVRSGTACGSRKLIGGTIDDTRPQWGHVDRSEPTSLVREGAIGSEKGPMEVNRCGAGGLALPGKAALPMKAAG